MGPFYFVSWALSSKIINPIHIAPNFIKNIKLNEKKKETKKVAEIEREIRALPSKIIDPTPVNPNFI